MRADLFTMNFDNLEEIDTLMGALSLFLSSDVALLGLTKRQEDTVALFYNHLKIMHNYKIQEYIEELNKDNSSQNKSFTHSLWSILIVPNSFTLLLSDFHYSKNNKLLTAL